MQQDKFGFIGAGRMATALARGFLNAALTSPDRLLASDPSREALRDFAQATTATTTSDNSRVVDECRTVFLAVKPQHLAAVLEPLRAKLSADHLLISIAAGTPLRSLARWTGPAPRLIRVMPNTPCLVGQGASAYCLGSSATDEDGRLVEKLLCSVGQAHRLDERLLDAVTGLSGSGPAFVYTIIEALSDGGVRMGLPRGVATALAAQTVRGAAEMVVSTGEHPAALKDAVASPGGTTIAGLAALEARGVRSGLIEAVTAATRRSIELGADEQ